ncbi:MAG: hypothetical protein KKF27_21470, partial [Gammaproteobacteria bacterium]|nr:hypothetical protein [Gammaproteobacteria bacterium]
VPQTATWIGIVALIVMNTFSLIREQLKQKAVKKQNGSVDEIKDVIKRVDTKIDSLAIKVEKNEVEAAKVSVGIDGIKVNCASTITRFEKAITDNQNMVIDLIKERGK